MLDLATMSHDAYNVVLFHDIILKGKNTLKTGGKTYEYEVMQFTGLLDKNGKEIYEGDVVAFEEDGKKIAAVTWSEKRAQFHPGAKQKHSSRPRIFEVMGNIYETPDLLKK